MPFLTKADLTPPLYPEVIEAITRGNDGIVTNAINQTIKEMSIYLNRFNLLAMFGNATTEPTFEDDFLKNIATDIAAWNLVKLGNPNVNLELFRTAYTDAIKTLKAINNGNDADAPWPLKENDPNNLFDIASFSNKKRTQHY